MKKNRFLAWLLVVSMFFTMFLPGMTVSYADGGSAEPAGYVTISVEKFTLGQGYFKEPAKIPFYEDENGATVLTRLLGEGNYRNTGSIDSAFYLSAIRDNDSSVVNIPQYILDEAGTIGTKAEEDWLGEFDYTSMSGWMYAVNNEFLGYGFSDYKPQNGDVIRAQFTVYGFGADLGSGFDGSGYIEAANKDALTAKIAEINNDPNKDSLLSHESLRAVYEQAYTLLTNMESTQASVDQTLSDLNQAIENANDTEKPVIKVEGLEGKNEVTTSDLSFRVTVTDNVSHNITPEVKLNGVGVPETGGEYKVSLNAGVNLIKVTATDGAGNKAEESFSIKYNKVVPPLTAKEQLNKNLAYIVNKVSNPTFGTGSGEWSVLSLARGDYQVPNGYYDIYYNNVVKEVQALMTKNNGKLDATKGTEHSRLILGLTSIGRDISDVASYDIKKELANLDYVKKQGLNGPIFALLAFNAHNYEIPLVEGGDATKQTTRDKLIRFILDAEVMKGTPTAGGWALGVTKADTDMTAMALQALAPYYHKNDEVTAAIDRAVKWLSDNQNAEGSYTSWGSTSSESIAQVVVALSSLGIDANQDPKFVKNGKSALGALLTFAVPDGGFMHTKPTGTQVAKVDGMATDQGTYALVAYDRFVSGKNSLYDMTDVKIKLPEVPEVPHEIEIPLPTGEQPKVVIPQDNHDYIIPIKVTDSSKEITVEIPSGLNSKVSVNLPVNSSLPNLEATKGNVSVMIPKGTKVTSGDASALEIISSKDISDTTLTNNVNAIIPVGKKLDNIVQAFTMGGAARVEFSNYVTLTFAGMKGKDAAYIQNGSPHAIQKYSNEQEGNASGKSEYAYDRGNDLIVRTNHFTDYVAYTSSTTEIPGGEVTNPDLKKYVTVSVDKLTINKGFVVSTTKVELKSGDTAWSILQRMLDSRGISYDYSLSDKYGSVYVESIAGDGEFDHGSGSGWMYNVNGWYPDYGASKYILKEGDRLQWRYTTNLGADLGEDLSKWDPISVGEGIEIKANDKTPIINVPSNIQRDYNLNFPKELKNTNNITINIPDIKPKVTLNLEDVKDNIPMITANKGDISVVFDKGTRFKSGDRKVELITSNQDTKVQEIVQGTLNNGNKVKTLNHAFTMGNPSSSVLFDKLLTIIIKGAKGQALGFIENNKYTPITLYETEEQGMKQTQGSEKQTYGVVKGNDIYIKTNHFTTFVSYTVDSKIPTPGSTAGSTNGSATSPGTTGTTPGTSPGTSPGVTPVVVPNGDLNNVYSDSGAISNWAYDAILEATKNGFIQGSNGKFNPQASITRAEFTKILVNVLGLDTNLANGANFKDVRTNDWFYPYVNAANKAGLVTGYNNEFRPNDNITREQMAVTIVRALGVQPVKSGTAIKDINKASAWAKTDVETVTALGLMTGSGSLFNPKDVVTREMAAVVSTRVHNYKNDHKTTDNNTGKVDNVDSKTKLEVQKKIKDTAAFMQKAVTDPVIATVGGDWTVLGLARSDVKVPDAYYAKYYANVEKILKEKSGKLHSVKYTEYDRVILALTAIGKSIDNVAGYNLRERLADFDTLVKQGINGPIFALIALDSKHYEIPIVQGVKTQTTRELLIDFILNRELSGGGWALGERPDKSDADITAMVIQGLTPYYQTNPKVKAAVDRGVEWLSKAQTADGGYASWESANSESIAQVIVALTSLGINPDTDTRFIKNGHSALDALLSFAANGGGFYHIKSGGVDNGGAKPGEVDLMATDQAMYALVAYDRFVNGHTRLYDMTDVK